MKPAAATSSTGGLRRDMPRTLVHWATVPWRDVRGVRRGLGRFWPHARTGADVGRLRLLEACDKMLVCSDAEVDELITAEIGLARDYGLRVRLATADDTEARERA